MLPLLPFVAGVAVGAAALKLYRKAQVSPRVSAAVDRAEDRLRHAAVAGLERLRRSSESWRDRLAEGEEEGVGDAVSAENDAAAEKPVPQATAKPAPKKRAAKKEAA